ncbi:Maf family protein [Gilvimarinus algae]|uniref:7-methyl-GTP pyrophosphatase n=1 Tax=Gilvimarinus algae TaxID=3058037 RepID=A0ABT8TE15_9GAMM|nr:Maf family nucleotide pyrophosphatase [Gilvimarinus sp. SDUM040014]MDO3382293.1 Maf family nucleotide pyrophosphatase [Gilvimarinus sp. SDUM040014]
MREILLASSSPYRRALLSRLGVDFQWTAPNLDETPLPAEAPKDRALRLAEAKAAALAAAHPDHLIIGSDQVASLNGVMLDKPGSHERARAQLKACSGQSLDVYTGLCVYDSATGRRWSAVESYAARFRRLNDTQIEYYLQRDKPYDCAGSFKCESLGIALFEQLAGDDPNTLIGLPLIALTRLLYDAGIDLLAPPNTRNNT